MGVYDSVIVNCPKCNNEVEFQSKAGKSTLAKYTLEDAPPQILGDLHNEIQFCSNCNTALKIKTKATAKIKVK